MATFPRRHRRNFTTEVEVWLTPADAKSCVTLLGTLQRIKTRLAPHDRLPRAHLTYEPLPATLGDEGLVKLVRNDQRLFNKRLPLIFRILGLPSPEGLPFEIRTDIDPLGSSDITAAEIERLRNACAALCKQVEQEMFARNELPQGWSGRYGWPSAPIVSLDELTSYVENSMEGWMYPFGRHASSDYTGMTNKRQIARAPLMIQTLLNARIGAKAFGGPELSEFIFENIPAPMTEDNLRGWSGNQFVPFTTEDCQNIEARLSEVIYTLRDYLADKGLQEIANAPASARAGMLQQWQPERKKKAGRPPSKAAKRAKMIEFMDLKAGSEITAKQLAELVADNGEPMSADTIHKHYAPDFPAHITGTGKGYVSSRAPS